jgi:hypothetical protein
MSVTITKVSEQDVGNGQRIVADVAFDNSYPHGGEEITAEGLGFRVGAELDIVEAAPKEGRSVEFVPGNANAGKLLARDLIPVRVDYPVSRIGLTIGTSSAAEIKIPAVTKFVIATAFVELAAAEFPFTATTHDIAADADTPQERWFLLSTTDGINVVVTPGTIADVGLGVPPAIPANAAVIGLVKVVVAAGATPFNATTDDLDAAHLTTTFEEHAGEVYQGTDLSSYSVRVIAHGR